MLRVGITGGIGTGKSTITRIFEVLGIPVYDADAAARNIMNNDEELRHDIISAFGDQAYGSEGLNRKYIASIVFEDASKLELLNSLVHPATLRDADKWLAKQSSPYSIKEAALIFESGASQQLDLVIGVAAPLPLRLQRAMKRDKITKEEVMARMGKQLSETIKLKLCDHIIYNDEQHALIPQVLTLHEILLKEAVKKM